MLQKQNIELRHSQEEASAATMDTRGSPRGGSPLSMVPNKTKHVETSSASEEDDERKKRKRKMKRSGKRGEEEEKTPNVRDRSRSIDSGMASKLTKKKKKSTDIKKNESDEKTKEKTTNKKKKGGAQVSTSPVVREGRSMSMWEGGAPPSALVLHEDDEDEEDGNREGEDVNIKTKKSSSVRNALTCFIPLGGDEGKKVAEASGKDKKKLAAEILIASMDSSDSLDGGEVDEQKNEEKGEAEGTRKKGKHKRKSGGKTESEPPSSPQASSSSSSLTSSSSSPVHRLGAGMGFNKKQKSPQLSALEDMEHSSELPGGSMPPASSNDSGDGKVETSPLRLSKVESPPNVFLSSSRVLCVLSNIAE